MESIKSWKGSSVETFASAMGSYVVVYMREVHPSR